jgi:LPS sulfotransferase NodH
MKKPPIQHSIQRVKDVIRLRDPHVRNLALDFGLLAGHQDYVKFFILGRSRTGSNFLRGLLNSHPHARVFGELFQNPQEITWGFPNYSRGKRYFQPFKQAPVQFLTREIYRKVPRQIQAVGFKIFYYHAQTPEWKPIWTFLLEHKEIRVVHIKRQNILQTHLSKARAEQSGEWANITGKKGKVPPVRLSYEDLLEDFTRTREMEASYDALFADHPMHEVIYEDLARDYQAKMQQVTTFLGLPDCPLAPQTHKQTTEPLYNSIENYAELKARFQGSAWESFFED